MAWRRMPRSEDRKSAMEARVRGKVPVGILGYLEARPVAWCSIAPRPTYRALGGAVIPGEAPDSVWSLVCFFTRRELRGQGVSVQLLEAAVAHARACGADVIEAYPVDPDSPSYRFMGFVPLFEAAGFAHAGAAGTRRHGMRLYLTK